MTRLAVFTDASRVEVAEREYSTAYGWVALNMDDPESLFCIPRVKFMKEFKHSTVHAEFSAVWDAVNEFSQVSELHVFTDSLYAVRHTSSRVAHEERTRRPLRVYPERLVALANMDAVTLHHVAAHKSHFYNELVDQMVGFVTRGEMEPPAAEEWARDAFRRGVIEITITKGFKPKFVKRAHERNSALLTLARG